MITETDDIAEALDEAARRAAIDRAAGIFDGVYGPDYLDELRAEWPE